MTRRRHAATLIGAWVGAGLLVWSSVIHLHLWASGYRDIPTIGSLFLLQGVAGLVLALTVIAIPRRPVLFAGALFAAGTLGGLLLSVNVGLFGFRDSMGAPFALESAFLDVATVAVFVLSVVVARRRATRRGVVVEPGPSPSTRSALDRA